MYLKEFEDIECPYCESRDIEFFETEKDDEYTCVCHNCSNNWLIIK